jgi:replication-associated recombination protein RarA
VDYAAEAMDMKKHQMVILMKGHPGVGKSSIAICMAQLLQAPLIDKDDARDSFSSLRHTGPVGACRVTGFLLIQAGACS